MYFNVSAYFKPLFPARRAASRPALAAAPMAAAPMLALIAVLTPGCSAVEEASELLPDKKVEYKKAHTGNALELPPDLAAPRTSSEYAIPGMQRGSATFSDYSADQAQLSGGDANVLPVRDGFHIERDGDRRWLVVDTDADDLWERTHDFWLQEGFLLTLSDPTVGLMETDWNENRGDIPSGIIRNTLKKFADFAYSAPTRDKYRTRFERPANGSTEIYISHQGVREVIAGDAGNTVWEARPADPGLEAVMLSRLMVFMGLEKERADRMVTQAKQARTSGVEMIRNAAGVSLVLNTTTDRAWREVGLALDRVGFVVEDRDRAAGIYHVRYHDPLKDQDQQKGWLDKMKFWGKSKPTFSEDPYLVKVAADGSKTSVMVLDPQQQRDNSSTAQRILTLLHEQLQ